jgi:hypothetical protein
MNRAAGMILIVVGVAAVVTGILAYAGWLSWLGRLPGDIRYESDHVSVHSDCHDANRFDRFEFAVLFIAPVLLKHHLTISVVTFPAEFAGRLL